MTVRNPGDIATSGLASSAFARHYLRNLCWCLFLALLRCFSSGGSPHIPILFSIWYLAVGFPIRKSPDRWIFAPPRSLSQLVTSFIGSWCQGIPLALLLAWPRQNQLRKISYLLFANISFAPLFLLSNQNPFHWAFDLCLETMYKASLCDFNSVTK